MSGSQLKFQHKIQIPEREKLPKKPHEEGSSSRNGCCKQASVMKCPNLCYLFESLC